MKHEIKKKEPATIHIAKSNLFGIASVNLSENMERINSRRLSNILSPLRPESQRETSELSEGKFTVK